MEEAANVAVTAVNTFVKLHPNKLRKVRWVLFDQNTYEVYRKEIERQLVTDVVNSSELDRINRILRNGGV